MKGVYLVGAGPGDIELITVRGMNLIQSADVIVYDNLANPMLLNYKKSKCDTIYVGKKSSNHTYTQEVINQMLVDLSKKYECVVRLKGGDPYVFGRGSEEGEVLKAAGVHFEVVPGITSAIGGLCYGGIPITSRNVATSFHVVTGHLSSKSEPVDFESLARLKGTLVFLMGVKNLPNIVSELLKHGKSGETPTAIIYKASTPEQKVYTSTLNDIVDLAEKEAVKAPSLIVVGDVIKHREDLAFFEQRPLFGKHILVTRSRQNHSKLTDQLLKLGAKVTLMPAIKMIDINDDILEEKIESLSAYTTLILTSGVAVKRFMNVLLKSKDIRGLSHIKIAVVGSETAKVLGKYGLKADIIPSKNVNDALLEALKKTLTSQDRVLLPRSKKGDKDFTNALKELCAFDEIHTYDTVFEEAIIPVDSPIDYITFTSSSTVKGYDNQLRINDDLKEMSRHSKMISIGPKTSETIEKLGYSVEKQAGKYTIDGVVECLIEDVREDM